MNVCDPAEINVTQFKQLEHDYIGYQSLTDVPRALAYPESTGSAYVSFIEFPLTIVKNELN